MIASVRALTGRPNPQTYANRPKIEQWHGRCFGFSRFDRVSPWEAIEMSVESQTAFEIGSRSVAPFAWVPPRGFGASLAALGPMATALLKVRQFLEALKGIPRKRRGGRFGVFMFIN